MFRNILLMMGLLVCTAVAQQQSKVTIVTYALGGPEGGFKAFFKNGQEIKPFAANGSGLGDPIKYQGPKRFEIRASEAAFSAPPAGQQPEAPLAFVDLPDGVSYVLLLAVDAGGGKIRLLAYDISTNALKPGDYWVFNFSRSTLGMNMGKAKILINPAQNEILRDSSFSSPDTKVLEFKVYKIDGQTSKLVKSSPWEHYNTKRIVMFLFDGKHKGEAFGMMSLNIEEPPREKAGAAAGAVTNP